MIKKLPEQVLVFIGSFVVFLLTLAENFSGPHDSITYLNGIVDGYPLVNQHHLLYHYAAWCWLQVLQPVFPSVKNYYILESFSAVWGSCSMAVIYSFFRYRFKFTVGQATAAILVIAFSYGFWFYSVNIEVYAAPLFFILLALYYICQPRLTVSDWWKVIMLHILAILFHQINILFAVIILLKLWQQRKQINFLRWLSAYAVSGIVFVGTAYFIVGWIVEKQNTVSKWFAWMRGYADGDTYWQALTIKTPVNVGYGFSHALLGGHYIFQVPPVKKMINATLSSHSLGDELYIARNISTPMALFLLTLTVLLFIMTLWLLIRFIRNFRSINTTYHSIIVPLIATFLLYSVFFTFWMPEILEFWILQTVILWLLLLGTLTLSPLPFRLKPVYVSLALASLLFCINYFGSMRWMQDKKNDLYYVNTATLQKEVTQNDLVILQSAWILKDFLHYFTAIKVQSVPLKDSSHVTIDQAFNTTLLNKGRVFILPEIKNKMSAQDTKYIDSLRTLYSTRWRQFREKDPQIWVIE